MGGKPSHLTPTSSPDKRRSNVARYSYTSCPKCREKGRDNRGNNLAMYDDGSGHCFACGFHIFPKHYVPKAKVDERPHKSLPADLSRDIPGHAWKWLLQWGLSYQHWRPHVWWTEKDSRLVFEAGGFYTGRFLGTEPAEGRKPAKWFHWGDAHKAAHVHGAYSEATQVVLVEDLISAHKIAISAAPAIALFGTNVFPACISTLRHIGLPVCLWLDKDQEHTMPTKAAKLNVLTNLPVRYVVTDDDPKGLSLGRIQSTLSASN